MDRQGRYAGGRADRPAGAVPVPSAGIEQLEAKGAFFRSLQDPIDTASPQGKFTLQVLGAVAGFERALIRERTRAGLASARMQGRFGGNRGLRTGDPVVLRKLQLTRTDGYLERLNQTAQDWVPQVRRLRPDMAWKDVLRLINTPLPPARRWSQGRLLRAVRAYVREGFLPETILGRASRKRRPPARHHRRPQGGRPRDHPAGPLRPAGGQARTHAPRPVALAAVIGEDSAGAGEAAGPAVIPCATMRFRSSATGIYETLWIPPNVPHRFINASDRPMRIFWTYATIDATRTMVASGEIRTIEAEHMQAPEPPPLHESKPGGRPDGPGRCVAGRGY